jgi:hypothetical protein
VNRLGNLDVKTVRLGLLGLVVVAVAVFLIVTVVGGDDDDSTTDQTGEPVGLSEADLISAAAGFSHPAYWIGPLPTTEQYELTDTTDGRIYVRYLPQGAEVGDPSANYLTVGTYPVPNAKEALTSAAEGGGTKGISRQDGYSVLEGDGGNVYVVFDDQPDLQIEVFAPGEGDALELAESGALKQIG